MDPQDLRTLQLLDEIEKNRMPSQRQLAHQLNISLGLVNSFIKRLAQKGYFKITHVPKNRVKYILTAKGMAEKSRLTYEYITGSFEFYRRARKALRVKLAQLEKEGVSDIVFYGLSSLAEIAYLSLQETNLNLSAIIDDEHIGNKFFGYTVAGLEDISSYKFDSLMITAITSVDEINTRLHEQNIPSEMILQIQW